MTVPDRLYWNKTSLLPKHDDASGAAGLLWYDNPCRNRSALLASTPPREHAEELHQILKDINVGPKVECIPDCDLIGRIYNVLAKIEQENTSG